jgi:dTDP-4-dehydrorhamnose reductase
VRWLVVGAKGMLGTDLVSLLEDRGEHVVGVDRDDLDVTLAGQADPYAAGMDVIVNCAAYTAVDPAEQDEAAAFTLNAVGPAHLARTARTVGARLVQISTDYVFAGDGTTPYAEDSPVAPRSAYGRTKAAGEWAVKAGTDDYLVVRTAWLYGVHGRPFPATIARLLGERGSVEVVDDQHGQPTWTVDLADLVYRMVMAHVPSGTYHGTSAGETTWFGFARDVARAMNLDPDVVRPTATQASGRPAPRPAYSVLGHEQLAAAGVEPIGLWSDRWSAAADQVLGEVTRR